MKQFTFFLLLIFYTTHAICQQSLATKKATSPEMLERRSTNELVGGAFLVLGGTVLTAVGANAQRNAEWLDFTGALVEVLGLAGIAGSIPLFIAGGHHHKKAKLLAAGTKMETAYVPGVRPAFQYSFPALSLRVKWHTSSPAKRIADLHTAL